MTSDEVRVYLTEALAQAMHQSDVEHGTDVPEAAADSPLMLRYAQAALTAISTLRVPCPPCGGTGWVYPFETSPDQPEICGICHDTGQSALLAFDEMRGGEWVTDELLDKPCPDDTVLMRFPAALLSPDTTETP